MVSLGSSCCNRSRTKACLVGEHAPGNTPAHGGQHRSYDRTTNTTGNCIRSKSHAENLSNTCRQSRSIDNNNNHSGYKIESSHSRNNHAGNSTDAADAPKQHRQAAGNKNHAYNHRTKAKACLKGGRNGICLSHIADTERSTNSKEGKQASQGTADSLVAKAVLHSVHRPTGHLAYAIGLPVLYCQHGLTILGGKTKSCGNPHPYQGTRTAQHHGRGNTYDIAGAHSSGKSRHQRLERADITSTIITLADNHLDCIRKIAPRQKLQPHCQENTRPHQECQHHRPPDKIINICHQRHQIHKALPPNIPGSLTTSCRNTHLATTKILILPPQKPIYNSQ